MVKNAGFLRGVLSFGMGELIMARHDIMVLFGMCVDMGMGDEILLLIMAP